MGVGWSRRGPYPRAGRGTRDGPALRARPRPVRALLSGTTTVRAVHDRPPPLPTRVPVGVQHAAPAGRTVEGGGPGWVGDDLPPCRARVHVTHTAQRAGA